MEVPGDTRRERSTYVRLDALPKIRVPVLGFASMEWFVSSSPNLTALTNFGQMTFIPKNVRQAQGVSDGELCAVCRDVSESRVYHVRRDRREKGTLIVPFIVDAMLLVLQP